jgi:hypothetical protein
VVSSHWAAAEKQKWIGTEQISLVYKIRLINIKRAKYFDMQTSRLAFAGGSQRVQANLPRGARRTISRPAS